MSAMGIVQTFDEDIRSRLRAVRRRKNRQHALHGMLLAAGSMLAVALVAVFLESTLFFGPLPRTILFWLPLTAGVGTLSWFAGGPILRLLYLLPDHSDHETARDVGRAYPQIADRLVNVLQLSEQQGGASIYYSQDLVNAAIRDLAVDIADIDFMDTVSFSGTARLARALGLGAVLALLMVLLVPGFPGSAARLLRHDQVFAEPAPFALLVEPGNREVVKGESVPVSVRVMGEQQAEVIVASRPEGQLEFDEQRLVPDPDGIFRLEFASLKATTEYHAVSGLVRTETYRLSIVDRPVVRLLRIRLDYPRYARLPLRQLDDNMGDVAALKGTVVTFMLEANKELAIAELSFQSGPGLPLRVDGTKAHGRTVLQRDQMYTVRLEDRSGTRNADPITYSLRVIADAFPSASIPVPGVNLEVTDKTELPLLFRISDDFGFTKLHLAYRLVQSRYERPADEWTRVSIPLPAGITTEASVPYTWPLAPLALAPEDVVQYFIEVFDNDDVSGPKSSVSETFTLRLPSLEEVFSDVDKGHEAGLEALRDAMLKATEAQKELDNLHREVRKDQQKLDWQDQKSAENLLKKYEEIRQSLDQVNRRVQEMTEKLQRNDLLSQETLEKYQELQHVMEEMNSPELVEAMKRLQEALQQVTPEALRQALQTMQFSEEAFRKSIERTLNLLKRIQIEQKLDEMVRRMEEMIQTQENLRRQTEKTDAEQKEQLNRLAREQKELGNQLGQLERTLQDVQTKMQEFPREMPMDELGQAQQELEQSGLESQMDQIAQQMEQGLPQDAAEQQRAAQQSMDRVLNRLQQTQHALQRKQQREVVQEMRRVLQDLLELSKRQEALKQEALGLEQNSQGLRGNARQQAEVLQDLGQVTNRLAGLSQKTFSVSPEMGKSIGDAMRSMGQAMEALDQRNGKAAGDRQLAAMGSLNEAAQQMQGALSAMMQGGGQGMGMAGFMQRLQQMAGTQEGINEATRGMLTQQQAAEMARLAGDQGAVRKSLEQLAREAAISGNLNKLLGDLNRIAQDMREVQTDLAQHNVNPETLRKQERILSRLLDSQRSMRERDFEQRRKAESGRTVARRSPRELDLSTQEGKNRLRQDLLKALEEGYARDYEVLIRKYFEALEQ